MVEALPLAPDVELASGAPSDAFNRGLQLAERENLGPRRRCESRRRFFSPAS